MREIRAIYCSKFDQRGICLEETSNIILVNDDGTKAILLSETIDRKNKERRSGQYCLSSPEAVAALLMQLNTMNPKSFLVYNEREISEEEAKRILKANNVKISCFEKSKTQ